MKIIIAFMFIVTTLLSDVEWLSYEEAQVVSKRTCKPIFLDVYRVDCGACNALFSGIEKNEKLQKVISLYVPARITAEDALYEYETKVESTPTIMFMDPQREEMLRSLEGLPSNPNDLITYSLNGIKAMKSTHKCFVLPKK